MSFRRVGIRASLPALPMLLLLAGCPFTPDRKNKPDPIPPDLDYVANTSITNVLANLKTSYNKHNNIEQYKKLLDPSYTYIFDPRDVGGEHNIPESWGYSDDVLSAEHLFGSEPNVDGYRMEDINLTFSYGADVVSTVQSNWRMVTLAQIALYVYTRNNAGESLIYEALNSKAEIHFIRTDELDPASQARIWKIIYWVDKPDAALAAKN
jgi:hypothetical protein